jgi:UDP-N-acetylglucosamine acyltransferase
MAEPQIHPSAIVSPLAKLADDVVIDAYAIVHDHVEIGVGTTIGAHTIIHDYVRIGAGNLIHSSLVIGGLPQVIGFDATLETWLEIGDNNTLREGVTIHRASKPETVTRIGSNCFLMAFVHIGHDCQLGDHVTMANNVLLGGHVEVGSRVVIGGGTPVHQFVRIGDYAMVGGFTPVRKDVMPFTMFTSVHGLHFRLNSVGLRRNGIKGERFRVVEQAFRQVRAGNKDLGNLEQTEEIVMLQQWLAVKSKRGLSAFQQSRRAGGDEAEDE